MIRYTSLNQLCLTRKINNSFSPWLHKTLTPNSHNSTSSQKFYNQLPTTSNLWPTWLKNNNCNNYGSNPSKSYNNLSHISLTNQTGRRFFRKWVHSLAMQSLKVYMNIMDTASNLTIVHLAFMVSLMIN